MGGSIVYSCREVSFGVAGSNRRQLRARKERNFFQECCYVAMGDWSHGKSREGAIRGRKLCMGTINLNSEDA